MTKQAPKKPAGKLPEPPSGGREAQGGQFNFWNPKKPGDVIQGTLAGTVEIKNQRDEKINRYTLLSDKKLYVLPDHLNLVRMMGDIESNNGGASTGIKVWIQFLGKRPVEGVDQPMAFYRVADYGKE